jgi:putative FmdB family regulatory protein
MVLYEYKCDACGREWEDNERAMTLGRCIVCGKGEMKRRFSVPNLTGLPTRGSRRDDFSNRDLDSRSDKEDE